MSNTLNIKELIDSDQNVYEMTCVAIKEAAHLSGDKETVEDLEKKKEKIVSVALNKVLEKSVEYNSSEQR